MPLLRRTNALRTESSLPHLAQNPNGEAADGSKQLRSRNLVGKSNETSVLLMKLLLVCLFINIGSHILLQGQDPTSISKSFHQRPSRELYTSLKPKVRLNGLLLHGHPGKRVSTYSTSETESMEDRPDLGDLNIAFTMNGRRKIKENSRLSGEVYPKNENDDFDPYYAFDDDIVRATPFGSGNHCRRTSWHKSYFPTCNSAHETRIMEGNNKFLG